MRENKMYDLIEFILDALSGKDGKYYNGSGLKGEIYIAPNAKYRVITNGHLYAVQENSNGAWKDIKQRINSRGEYPNFYRRAIQYDSQADAEWLKNNLEKRQAELYNKWDAC